MERFIALALATAVLFGPQFAAADCACRHRDGKTPEGDTACIRTPQGPQLAVCEKVLNNTSWRFTGRPCPAASLGTDRETPRPG